MPGLRPEAILEVAQALHLGLRGRDRRRLVVAERGIGIERREPDPRARA